MLKTRYFPCSTHLLPLPGRPQLLVFKLLLGQSHTKSPQAFWPVGVRWERLCGNEKKKFFDWLFTVTKQRRIFWVTARWPRSLRTLGTRLLQLITHSCFLQPKPEHHIQIVHCFNFWKCWLFHLSYFQEAAWFVADECIQILGGMGYMKVSDSTCMLLCKIKGGSNMVLSLLPPSPPLPSQSLHFCPSMISAVTLFFPTDFLSSYKIVQNV